MEEEDNNFVNVVKEPMEKDKNNFENVVKEAVQAVILFDDKVGKLIEFIIATYNCEEYIKDMNKVSRYII